MSLQRVPINNFRGGLNTRDGPFDLQPNESPDLLNVTVSSLVGQLEARKGKTRMDTGGLPTSSPDNAKQVVIGNEKRFLMLSINGEIWNMNAAGECKKLFKGTAGTIWDFEVFSDAAFKDWVYCGNGVDAMQKWDGEAAVTVEWKATLGTIPKGGVLCVWENRMFISYVTANVQRVYFSEFGDPEATVKEYGFVDVRGPEEDLDAVQDLAVLGARLFVLKKRGVFYISNSVSMFNRRVGSPGVYSRFQTMEMEDKLYFFNPQGIWSTGGVEVMMESGQINSYFPEKLNKAQFAKVRLCVTRDTYPRLLLAVPTGSSTSNDTLIEMIPHINFRRIGGRRYLLLPAFMIHSIAANALATWNPKGEEETIVGTSSGVSPFANPAVLDSFKRAPEKPLSNAGKWITVEGAAQVIEECLKSDGSNPRVVWTEEFTEPEVTVFVKNSGFEGAGANVAMSLFICYKGEPATDWYRLKIERSVSAPTERWVVSKLVAGTATTLATFAAPVVRNEQTVGFMLKEGTLYLGLKKPGQSWVTIGEVKDASLNKGKLGISFTDAAAPGKWSIQNFAGHKWEAGEAVNTVARLFNGETDEGAPIEAHYQTSWMAIQAEEPRERLRRLNIELAGDIIVEVFKDFETSPAFTAQIPLAEEGEGTQYRFARVRPETRGRFHAVKFKSNLEGKRFLINVAELAIRGGKEH